MKTPWDQKPLDELCLFLNGLWIGKKPPYIKVGVIRNTNFEKDNTLDFTNIAYLDVEEKQFETRKLQVGDIILEKSGGGPKQPVGRVVVFEKNEGDYSFSNFTSVIRVKDNTQISYTYLHKYLTFVYQSGVTEKMQSHSTGIRNLKLDEYKKILVPIPPLPEQQRIVALLDQAFAAIDQAKAIAEENLQNARDLFETYLSTIFDNPSIGWISSKLGNIIRLEYGKPLAKCDRYATGKYPVYGANGLKDRTDKFLYDKYSIIVGRKGSAGEVNLTEKKFWPLDVTYYVVLDPTEFDLKFVYYLLINLKLPRLAKGVKPGINRNDVYSIKVYTPNLQEQQRIVEILNSLLDETKNLEQIYHKKILVLEELKRSMLQQFFSGKL